MTNHFHLQFYQHHENALPDLMRRVMTSYVMYFNLRHQRKGGLFQSRYKARLVTDESHLLHLSRYIHLNALALGVEPSEYAFSSYSYYLGHRQAKWLNPNRVLDLHKDSQPYYEFVESYRQHRDILEKINKALAL